jgi:tetratricopeptide (TPR) repeat protein
MREPRDSMARSLIGLGIVLTLSIGAAAADATTNRLSAARELMKAYKNAEALTAFTNLVAMGLSDADKSEALESAAYCAFRQRHAAPATGPLAMELAKQIPMKGASIRCRMLLMLENAHNEELIKTFKNENLAALPEDIAPEAFYMRGRAYASLKKGQEAEADFKMALERRPREQKYLMALGGNYFSNLKETQEALDTYQLVIQSAEKPHHAVDAVLEVARIHISNAMYSEALVALDNCKDLTAFSDYQRIQVLRAFGQAYAGLGREEEAIASFNEANQLATHK